MTFSRGFATLVAALFLSLPSAALAQAPAQPATTLESPAAPSGSSIADAVVKAVDDAGKSISDAVTEEIHTAEAIVADLASKAILYIALALCIGLVVGMVLGSFLSALILRGVIGRALAAAR